MLNGMEKKLVLTSILSNDEVTMPSTRNRSWRSKATRLWTLFFTFLTFCVLWASDIFGRFGEEELAIDLFPYQNASLTTSGLESLLSEDKLMFQKELELIGNVLIPQPEYTPIKLQKNCGRRPRIYEIKFSNVHWQMVTIRHRANNSNIYLYGAYLDTREDKWKVRILFLADQFLKGRRTPHFCQFWYKNKPVPSLRLIRSLKYLWWEEWGIYGRLHPYIATCDMTPRSKESSETNLEIPESVSIVEAMCDLSGNELKINYELPPTSEVNDFGVCVKGLDLPTKDISKRLVEWIEMILLLGAKGIHFHQFVVHPNVAKVLEYYIKTGVVTVKPTTFAGFQPNLPSIRRRYAQSPEYIGKIWRQEPIYYNDCFLTHMYKYKYIAALDIDEIILPKKAENWKELVENIQQRNPNATTYCFESRLFFNNPKHLPPIDNKIPYMMRTYEGHRALCKDYEIGSSDAISVKCFHNTEQVLAIHNHYPRYCFDSNASVTSEECYMQVNSSMGYVHHHREACDTSKVKGNELTFDPTILRFNDQLMSRVEFVLSQLSL